MVYRGKPSAACTPCKTKKIRCEEERPSCGQCLKYRRTCSWKYADRNDSLFQNETSVTIRRASRPKKPRSQAPVHEELSPGLLLQREILSNPAQSVDIAALTFYVDGMLVTPASNGRYVGHLDVLPRMYLTAGANSALAKATRSTSLAVFSAIGAQESPIAQRAYQAYGESVAAIYQASKDPELRCRNETLVAVLLMLVNEALLARDKAPQTQWSAHVFGAMQLVLIRGSSIFDDPIGRKLFFVVRNFLAVGMPPGAPAHPFFDRPDLVPDPSPERRLGDLTMTLYHLRPRVLEALSTGKPLGSLIQECRTLGHDLDEWTRDLPEKHQYTTISADRHQYRDGHNQRLWNSYRCNRIFASALEYRCLQSDATALNLDIMLESPEIIHCLENLQLLADEISASLPDELRVNYTTGNSSGGTITTTTTSSNSSSNISSPGSTASPHPTTASTTPSPPATKTLPGPSLVQSAITAWYLVWPLYVSLGILSLPSSQRTYLRSRLLLIADKYRFRQAAHLVDVSDGDPLRPLYVDGWGDGEIENVWEKVFEYGCGAI